MLRCPTCRASVKPREENPSFPFCSPRCRAVDLGKWFTGSYRVPDKAAPPRRSGALGSIVVERIVDGIVIGVLGIVALRLLGDSASGKYVDIARSASVLVAAGFFALCVGLVLAVLFCERALRLSQRAL